MTSRELSTQPRCAESACSTVVSAPQLYGMRKHYGMRTVKKVLPGWPQAVWVLSCGHRQIIPTWSDGRVSPKPKGKVYCEECWHAEWDRRHAAANPSNTQVSNAARSGQTK